jgi:hypothetical protein
MEGDGFEKGVASKKAWQKAKSLTEKFVKLPPWTLGCFGDETETKIEDTMCKTCHVSTKGQGCRLGNSAGWECKACFERAVRTEGDVVWLTSGGTWYGSQHSKKICAACFSKCKHQARWLLLRSWPCEPSTTPALAGVQIPRLPLLR